MEANERAELEYIKIYILEYVLAGGLLGTKKISMGILQSFFVLRLYLQSYTANQWG